jgi:hypothetical protein
MGQIIIISPELDKFIHFVQASLSEYWNERTMRETATGGWSRQWRKIKRLGSCQPPTWSWSDDDSMLTYRNRIRRSLSALPSASQSQFRSNDQFPVLRRRLTLKKYAKDKKVNLFFYKIDKKNKGNFSK